MEVPAAVFAATVTWAEHHPGEGTGQFWRNFAAAVGQGRGDLPADALGRLCRAVASHQPGTAAGPLLGAYLSAVPAALLDDPHLDTATVHWAISQAAQDPDAVRAAADALRQVLPGAFRPGLALPRALLLLELADALQVSDPLPPQAAQLLASALLAGGGQRHGCCQVPGHHPLPGPA